MKTILEVKNLKKYFPIFSGVFRRHTGDVRAVDGISFSVGEGQIVGLVGESGSGKSTACRAAIRLVEPTSGEISFLGEDILKMSERQLRHFRKSAQMVFQDPLSSLNPRKTILDNVGEALLYHKICATQEEMKDRVVDILKKVGLESDILYQYPHQFSGGQQQRISIGRALAFSPKLLVCDEVVSALDISIQAQILNLLYDLKTAFSLSILFVSHDLSIVKNFCDSILVMHQGKIVERGESAALFENPTHYYTKTLFSSLLKGHPKGRH